MNYDVITIQILNNFGINDKYKGCKYVSSCIEYISINNDAYMPVTKILYREVGKIHNTSWYNVENRIRNIIDKIWNNKNNEDMLVEIFGYYDIDNKPSNLNFLLALYYYEKSKCMIEESFICPFINKRCEFCNRYNIT